jgi:hypothetical protein
VHQKRLKKGEATCDAQTAKGKPRKQITSGFSEPFENYAVFCAMNIKILSLKYKIITRSKNLETIRAHAESTDLIS